MNPHGKISKTIKELERVAGRYDGSFSGGLALASMCKMTLEILSPGSTLPARPESYFTVQELREIGLGPTLDAWRAHFPVWFEATEYLHLMQAEERVQEISDKELARSHGRWRDPAAQKPKSWQRQSLVDG